MNSHNNNLSTSNNNNNNLVGTTSSTRKCNNSDCVGRDCNCFVKETHVPGYDAKEKFSEHHGKGENYETHTESYSKTSNSTSTY